jgi:hypothetical protein
MTYRRVVAFSGSLLCFLNSLCTYFVNCVCSVLFCGVVSGGGKVIVYVVSCPI